MRRTSLLLLPVFLLFSSPLFAQYCSSPTTQYCCNFGITNVTFNTINNNSGNAVNGYEDFSNQSTTVFAGQSYAFSATAGNTQNHNFRVWIDYNNDQTFDPNNELAFSADDVLNPSGSILIPATAVAGVSLRMRVSADWSLEADPTPCANLARGQAEDYTIVVSQNTSPPAAAFTVDETVVCNGTVQFTDQSTNIPTAWYWDFGDGNTSNVASPTHTYDTSGTFSVTLIVSNVFGEDTVTQSNLITVDLDAYVTPANCTPATAAFCCNYGIVQVTFAGINKSSGNAAEGYRDFSCGNTATVTEGSNYSLTVVTGPDQGEDVKIWVDYNNDGSFNDTTEVLFFSTNEVTHSTTISIPGGAVLETALRMRVMSDFVGNALTPCGNPQWGQAEDYSIIINPNTDPPVAAFIANPTSTCDGIIEFTDLSSGFPDGWLWNFGDGNISGDQNPTHTYSSTGTYTVTLEVTNPFGTDTEVKTNLINVESTTGGPIDAICSPETQEYCCGIGIYQFSVGDINHTTGDGSEGYQDYSCEQLTELEAGQSYSIFVETGPDFEETVGVWIDFNNDGLLNDATEKVMTSINQFGFHFDTFSIPDQGVVGNTPLRMRVASDFGGIGTAPGPCDGPTFGQIEDYAVVLTGEIGIEENALANAVSVYPNPTSDFATVSISLPNVTNVSLQLHNTLGQLLRSQTLNGNSTISETLDLSDLPSGIYLLELQSNQGNAVKRIVVE